MNLRDRQDLQKLREQASEVAKTVPNSGWKKAYNALAQAANVLDAFWARSEVAEVQTDVHLLGER